MHESITISFAPSVAALPEGEESGAREMHMQVFPALNDDGTVPMSDSDERKFFIPDLPALLAAINAPRAEGDAPASYPLNYDHADVNEGRSAAHGWARSLYVNDKGVTMARVLVSGNTYSYLSGEHNDGVKPYAFTSPFFSVEHHEDGRMEITGLISLALTNNPAMRQDSRAASQQPKGATMPNDNKDKDARIAELEAQLQAAQADNAKIKDDLGKQLSEIQTQMNAQRVQVAAAEAAAALVAQGRVSAELQEDTAKLLAAAENAGIGAEAAAYFTAMPAGDKTQDAKGAKGGEDGEAASADGSALRGLAKLGGGFSKAPADEGGAAAHKATPEEITAELAELRKVSPNATSATALASLMRKSKRAAQ